MLQVGNHDDEHEHVAGLNPSGGGVLHALPLYDCRPTDPIRKKAVRFESKRLTGHMPSEPPASLLLEGD